MSALALLARCGLESVPDPESDIARRLVCPQCGRGAARIYPALDDSGEVCLECVRCQPGGAMRFTPAAFRRRFGSSRGQTAEAALPKEGEEGLPRFARTDAGNAELFAELYGNIARYVHQVETWRVWTGKRWADDITGKAEQLALLVARDRLRAAADLPEDFDRREEAKWALRSESVDKRRDLLAAASTMPELACVPEDFDKNPFLLNCLNGVVDLRSGELRPHDSKLMQSKLLPVPYDPKATCPRWLRFLEEVLDGSRDLADFVRRAVGYSLTGDTREHALLLLHGSGCNGKTVFLGTLLRLLGDYGASTDFATLTVDRERQAGIRNDIARLHGARLVTASETSEGVRFSEGVLKQLTGGDRVAVRFLHREFFEFTPTFKLWVACNHRPRVRDSSEAFWRRIRLVPFTVSFRGREDKGLVDTLAAELPGILAWAVRGCLEWQEVGDLCAPAEVLAATEGYRAAEDQVERFLAECCLRSPEATCGAMELYNAYREWGKQAGEYVESQTRFGGRLAEKGFVKDRHPITRGMLYRGLGLVAETAHGL